MLVWDFLDVEGFVAKFPEKLVRFGWPKLVAEQNDTVVGDEGFHGGNQRRHGLTNVNDVGCDYEVEGRVEGSDLLRVVPVKDGVLQGLAEGGLVHLQVALQGRHHGRNIREDHVSQAQ